MDRLSSGNRSYTGISPMTPTPAETALWRALNVEPESFPVPASDGVDPVGRITGWRKQNAPYRIWLSKRSEFGASHPADRLAYFEGKVRAHGWQQVIYLFVNEVSVRWNQPSRAVCAMADAPTEHLARFHAAARAIHALGMITEQQLKEISDGEGCN